MIFIPYSGDYLVCLREKAALGVADFALICALLQRRLDEEPIPNCHRAIPTINAKRTMIDRSVALEKRGVKRRSKRTTRTGRRNPVFAGIERRRGETGEKGDLRATGERHTHQF